jgi:hypothetical protein
MERAPRQAVLPRETLFILNVFQSIIAIGKAIIWIVSGSPRSRGYLERVVQLGETVLMPRTPMPGVGSLAICQDTERNRFGLVDDENVV